MASPQGEVSAIGSGSFCSSESQGMSHEPQGISYDTQVPPLSSHRCLLPEPLSAVVSAEGLEDWWWVRVGGARPAHSHSSCHRSLGSVSFSVGRSRLSVLLVSPGGRLCGAVLQPPADCQGILRPHLECTVHHYHLEDRTNSAPGPQDALARSLRPPSQQRGRGVPEGDLGGTGCSINRGGT